MLPFSAKIDRRKATSPLETNQRSAAKSLSLFNQLLCAAIGLLLTISGTFIEAHIIKLPGRSSLAGIELQAINVNFQIGAVFLTGCLGGQNAGAISQIAYLLVGLVFLPVFDRGGSLDYLAQPGFGYLIGFVPGAWLCGKLAYYTKAKIEVLAWSSLCGLAVVHLCGIVGIAIGFCWQYFSSSREAIELILQYSIYPLPGQLIIICAVATLGFILRRTMFN